MIKGIQAFEACWMQLRSMYPTDQDQNLMIAQAMGQVTDCYGTVEEVEQTLPVELRDLFRKLIHAYFHGYAINGATSVNSNDAVIPVPNQLEKSIQNCQTASEKERVDNSGKSPDIDKLGRRPRRRFDDFRLANLHEADTLILEIPFTEESL